MQKQLNLNQYSRVMSKIQDCKVLLNFNRLKVLKFYVNKNEEYSIKYNNLILNNYGLLIKNLKIEDFIKDKFKNVESNVNTNEFLDKEKQYQYLILYKDLKDVVHQVIVSDFKEQCFIHINFNRLEVNQNKELDSNHFFSIYNEEKFKLYYFSKLNFELINIPFILHSIILNKNLITNLFNCQTIHDFEKNSLLLYPVGFLLFRWLLIKRKNPDAQILFTEEPILKVLDKFKLPLSGKNLNKEINIGLISYQDEYKISNNIDEEIDENDGSFDSFHKRRYSNNVYINTKNLDFQMRQYLSLMMDSKVVF
jgi:hypothetical protein